MIKIVEVFQKQKFWACIEILRHLEKIKHENDKRENLLFVRTQNIEWFLFSLSQYNTKIPH